MGVIKHSDNKHASTVGGLIIQSYEGSVIISTIGEEGEYAAVDAYPPDMAERLIALLQRQIERAKSGESDYLDEEQLIVLDGNEVGDLTTGTLDLPTSGGQRTRLEMSHED